MAQGTIPYGRRGCKSWRKGRRAVNAVSGQDTAHCSQVFTPAMCSHLSVHTSYVFIPSMCSHQLCVHTIYMSTLGCSHHLHVHTQVSTPSMCPHSGVHTSYAFTLGSSHQHKIKPIKVPAWNEAPSLAEKLLATHGH